MWVLGNPSEKGTVMNKIARIGVDLAKNLRVIHGVQPCDSTKGIPQHPQETMGRRSLVAVLLRWQLWRCTYRDRAAIHRTAENAALISALDAYGVRAILPALKSEV